MEQLIGQIHTEYNQVTRENTAYAVGSGSLQVFSTPMTVALMEKAAANMVQKRLENGLTSVGVNISIDHISATPVGARVWAEACVEEVNGREVCFTVTAYDEAGVIAKGTHKRVTVKSDSFQRRANEKLAQKV